MPVSYRFDRFELRCAQHELVGPGRKVHLKARTMALLMALIENQASVVSKERLLELVWPDSAVEENNLAVHVSTLRKLLGHKAIVTVPGRGYRFCLQVEPTDDGDPAADVALQMAGAGLPERPVLFGREQELLELLNLAERHRVVTVCGPTGVGKTSLAVAAAHELAGSRHVVWLDLSGNEQEQRVPLLLAQALHIDVVDNDNKDDDVCAALVAHLRGPQWLLIIDSAEHALRPVAELVRTLLAGGQELHALVTNQAPLHLEGERVFRLRPLSVPQTDVTPEQALRHGAIALFVDQAQAADRRFALTTANTSQVVELCRQLDGLPLGIKLAAARMRMFGVQGLDARLSDRFRLLKATSVDLPSRQQTLIAALDWSHGLLSAVEQAVFRRLGVFAGGFTLELAAATARDEPLDHSAVEDALQGLIDHSLVAIEQVDPPRYRLLESARDYALLRLARAGEEHTTRHRHARALHALFEALDSAYWAPDKAEVPSPSAHAAEIANLRVALDWCLANDMLLGVQILGTLQVLFDWLGLHHEARERHARFALAAGGAPPPVFARFCIHRARLLRNVDNRTALALAESAVEAFKTEGASVRAYHALCSVAVIGASIVSPQRGRQAIEELRALEKPDWPARLLRHGRFAEAAVLDMEGATREACRAAKQCVTLALRSGICVEEELANLACAYLLAGETGCAIATAREVAASPRSEVRLSALWCLAVALMFSDRIADAREPITQFFEVVEAHLAWAKLSVFADMCALFAAGEQRFADAARLVGFADAAYSSIGRRLSLPVKARELAWTAIRAGLDDATICACLAEGKNLRRGDVVRLTLGPAARAGARELIVPNAHERA